MLWCRGGAPRGPAPPWRGAALGCAGAAKACGFEPMGAVVPRWCSARSSASWRWAVRVLPRLAASSPWAPLAQAGWGVGRTSPGGWSGRSNWAGRSVRPGLLAPCGQGRVAHSRGRLGFVVVHSVPAAGRPIRGGAFVPCAFEREGAGGASRAGGGGAPQRYTSSRLFQPGGCPSLKRGV